MKRIFELAFLLISLPAITLPGVTSTAGAEDWYRYRGPRLDGISLESGWRFNWTEKPPAILWQVSVGTGLSSVAVSKNRVFTIGNSDNVDNVFCLDATTGKTIWKQSYLSPTDANEFEGGPTSTPTVDGDRVFTLGRQGDLFCFDAESGNVQWSVNVAEAADVRIPTWGFSGSPLVVGDLLILNVGDAGTAVNKFTGKLVWQSADKDSGYSTAVPIGDSGDVVLGSARSYVCVNAKTGSERWRQRWLTTFGCNAADAIVSGDKVFLSSGYNRGCALLDIAGSEPSIVYKNKDLQNQISCSVLIGGHVYGIHGDVASGPSLRCMELSSGEVKWTNDELRPSALTAADGKLIVLCESGDLVVCKASAKKLSVLASRKVLDGKCWTVPVISNGRIFCRDAEGNLVCVDARST